MCHTLFISRNHCNKLLQSVWLKTAAMYSLRVLEAEVPSPGEGRAAVPPAPQGKALPASSPFRWPRCLNRAAKTPFPGRGGSAAPVAAWRTLPEATRTLGGRVRGQPRGRGGPTLSAARRPVLSPAPPSEAALPFHAPFTGGKAETSVSLGRGLQATRWPAQGWTRDRWPPREPGGTARMVAVSHTQPGAALSRLYQVIETNRNSVSVTL